MLWIFDVSWHLILLATEGSRLSANPTNGPLHPDSLQFPILGHFSTVHDEFPEKIPMNIFMIFFSLFIFPHTTAECVRIAAE